MKYFGRTGLAASIIFAFLFIPNLIYAADFYSLQSDIAANETQDKAVSDKTSSADQPIGTAKGRTFGDVFGRSGGFIHPFLAVTEYYTDNVFYSRDNRKHDFATILSPGIWLTVPHVYEKLLQIETANISPGGFNVSRFQPEIFKRYQLYLFYNADFERFSKFSSQNADNHRAEGFFQYNLKSGLTLELVDQFTASHDARGTGITTQLDKFRNNLANITLIYDTRSRFNFKVDYSNFLVDYLSSRNSFRNRDDNTISGYIFYKLRPKTSAFIEYEFIDVRYRDDTLLNSKEQHWFGGLQWDITAKSRGSIKAGYGIKDFINSSLGSSTDFILEAQVDYHLTPKTTLMLKASRKTNETNVSATDFILSNSVDVQYLQKITGKITADVKLSYTNDRYKGDVTFNDITKKLVDNYYTGVFAVRYKFREWLQTDLGYIYERRDSNFSDFDYTANIVFLRVTGTL